jgi:2-polyprenyl-3-methyl-5-hydroxy-6-metoxy-1,4-benzoquinol methylase
MEEIQMAVIDNKICFILNTNNSDYLKECLLYLSLLEVPKDYEVDCLTVDDAQSMAEGYNRAMNLSDAKYKVYLHQDVLIINKRFIYDLLKIFKSDEKIGIMGIVGNRSLNEYGAPFSEYGKRRIGELYMDLISNVENKIYSKANAPCEDVIVLDGLLMATQYDLPWREDLFKGWDFYDCSQSIEFIKAGYRCVVPHMDEPWVLHDNDIANFKNYEKWRQVFEREYKDIYCKWGGINNGKVTLLVMMHNNSWQTKRCIESLCMYCNTDNLELVVIDDHSDTTESTWVKSQNYLTYVYFENGEATYEKMINEVINTLGIKNDFIILDSSLWTESDFISSLKQVMDENSDIGTISPLFPCDNFNLINDKLLNLDSRLYETIVSQHLAIYIRYSIYELVNGMNEDIIIPFNVMMDFCLKVFTGKYRNIIYLDAVLNADCEIKSWDNMIPIQDVEIFDKNWGLHYLSPTIYPSLHMLITNIKTPIHNILEVGCASGYNLMGLKNMYPNASLYGLEINPRAAKIAGYVANVECGNVETDGIPFGDTKFDVIIFFDVLEHLRNPEAVVKMCRERLSDNGCIICSIPNVQHISVLNPLIHGRFTYTNVGLLDYTHIHLFTEYEIEQMFLRNGYAFKYLGYTMVDVSHDDKRAIDKLKSVFPDINEKHMLAFQYLVRVGKAD